MDDHSVDSSRCIDAVSEDDARSGVRESEKPSGHLSVMGHSGLLPTPSPRQYTRWNEEKFDEGYDSDGEIVFPDNYDDGEEQKEVELPDSSSGVGDTNGTSVNESGTTAGTAASINPTTAPPGFDDVSIANMTVDKLREELKKRGCHSTGLKAILVERLKEAVRNGPAQVGQPDRESADLNRVGFPVGCKWVPLVFKSTPVEEPSRLINGVQFRPPTLLNEESTKRLYDAAEEFDRPAFPGKALFPKRKANGDFKKTRQGKFDYEERATEDMVVDLKFVKKHDLSLDSTPVEWFEAFLPVKTEFRSSVDSNRHFSNKFSLELCKTWTNAKATAVGAGETVYRDFKPFTLLEIRQFIALYLFNGLAPKPQIELMFQNQARNPIFGNDLIARTIPNGVRRHRHFKAFFACCNPFQPCPENQKKQRPLFKIEPILKHAMSVSKEAVVLGKNLSCDEQTISFQGRHKDKLRINYKKEGDGFQADTICCDGYTFTFYFRNQPVSNNWTSQGFSPLYARVLDMVSQLPGKCYTLGMDNLYNSVKLSKKLWDMPQKVMAHGVIRANGRGVPSCIKQAEVTKREALANVRNTLTAAKIVGAQDNTPIVCACIYDQKPVYVISNACLNVTWVEKKRKVYHPEDNSMVDCPFHRLNLIDFYNNNMGSVDMADQLRLQYRVDHWLRNRKWWWPPFWWAIQMLLTNSYLMYCSFKRMHDQSPVNHRQFIVDIVLAWLSPTLEREKAFITTTSSILDDHMEAEENIDVEENEGPSPKSYAMSSLTGDTSIASRCTRLSWQSLAPDGEASRKRLNKNLCHLPVPKKNNNAYCQVEWLTSLGQNRNRNQISFCPSCQVHLCIQWDYDYHTIPEIGPDSYNSTD